MPPKKGKVLPKKGKKLHGADLEPVAELGYPGAIATALRQELGTTHQAIKLAMRWTGASERTVKYWFAGTTGPSGEHLIALARHSDVILGVFLQRAGRKHFAGALRIINARDQLRTLLDAIQHIVGDEAKGPSKH
jgi:hypothetical protein